MNIMLLCDEYPPGKHGGIGTAVQLMARTMVQMGHTVVVAGFAYWNYGGEDKFDDEGVKVYRFRPKLALPLLEKSNSLIVRSIFYLLKKTGLFAWDIRTSAKKYDAFLQGLIKKHNIDVAEMPDFNGYFDYVNSEISFPKPKGIPVIVNLHGTHTYFLREAGEEAPTLIKKLEKERLASASAVISVSQYTATRTAEYLDYDKNIEVIYNGINIPQLAKNITKVPGRVVFTGSLVAKKGIYQLMKAWNNVHAEIPDAELYIFGKGPVKKIKALLNNEASNSVKFMGHVSRDELFEHLAMSEVAVFPSYAECFALAPMEAMAVGTAVLYSTRTSGPELIADGINGKLANPDNIDSISSILITLLTDSVLCAELAANGQKLVHENFSIKHISQQHVAFYQKQIDKYNLK